MGRGHRLTITLLALYFGLLSYILSTDATLIASSKLLNCGRGGTGVDPRKLNNRRCSKKFVIALAVENGQVRFRIIIVMMLVETTMSHSRMPLVQCMHASDMLMMKQGEELTGYN